MIDYIEPAVMLKMLQENGFKDTDVWAELMDRDVWCVCEQIKRWRNDGVRPTYLIGANIRNICADEGLMEADEIFEIDKVARKIQAKLKRRKYFVTQMYKKGLKIGPSSIDGFYKGCQPRYNVGCGLVELARDLEVV